MRVGFVVAAMATGAGVDIGTVAPGHGTGVSGVATAANYLRVMVSRVRGATVGVARRQPGRGAVTAVTFQCRAEMAVGGTGRGRAVVATDAITGNGAVIKSRRQPGRGAVAGAAITAGLHVVGGLAGGSGAVVTITAGTGHKAVVDGRRDPGGVTVARAAITVN